MTTKEEFMECDTCRAKPGTPILCRGCLHNRSAMMEASKSQWQDEPTGDGWHWIEGGGAREVVKIKGKWMCEGAGGARPLNGRRVAPCTGRPSA